MPCHRVATGTNVDLARVDPAATPAFDGDKDAAAEELDRLRQRLLQLQELLYAEGQHRVLVVLQAMDAGGKDGTIRHVFHGVNPQGVSVAGFKAPTPEELSRDYLWRVHRHVPAKGTIVVFNRSHYEDVVIVRVKELVRREIWSRRYDQINAFEKMLADEGTTILKFFLHISRDEQKERLEARLAAVDKQWKFNPRDLEERARWSDYMAAYEAVLSRTSTEWAPWYLVPANKKWYRNLVVSKVLVHALERLDMRYPKPGFDPAGIVIE